MDTDDAGAAPSMTLLAADRAGRGEPLLLLHGIGSTRADFAGLGPRLAEHFEVLALDLPGHGESPSPAWPPTVAALTDAVGPISTSAGWTVSTCSATPSAPG
jgi:pimeloyl-ACP methyl ester carboxylesterase